MMADPMTKNTKKRGRPSKEKTTDQINGSNQAPIDLMSPPPPKRRATAKKSISNASGLNDDLDHLARIPKVFKSEQGNRYFTKPWWKEVTAKDEFWEQFEANIPVSIWKKRLTVHVVTEAKPSGTEPSRASGGTEPNHDASAISDISTSEGMFQCETCGNPFEAKLGTNWNMLGTIECETCLMAEMGNSDQQGGDKSANAKSRKTNDSQPQRKKAKPRTRGSRKSKVKESIKSNETEQLDQVEVQDELAETAQAVLTMNAIKTVDGIDQKLADGDKHLISNDHGKQYSVVPEPLQNKTQASKYEEKELAVGVEESQVIPSTVPDPQDLVMYTLPKDAKDMSSAASSIEMLSGNLETEKSAQSDHQAIDCEKATDGQEFALVDETRVAANDNGIVEVDKSTNDPHVPDLDNGAAVPGSEGAMIP